ncbi:chorion class high-cysteine HCB protein 13 [Eubacteriales bacterium OttesenSCG-928-M02]|nr:chorion class high-cysteine HCB protein 13 [Eubacteriales bacterium OttesenSCG-928-M02]
MCNILYLLVLLSCVCGDDGFCGGGSSFAGDGCGCEGILPLLLIMCLCGGCGNEGAGFFGR